MQSYCPEDYGKDWHVLESQDLQCQLNAWPRWVVYPWAPWFKYCQRGTCLCGLNNGQWGHCFTQGPTLLLKWPLRVSCGWKKEKKKRLEPETLCPVYAGILTLSLCMLITGVNCYIYFLYGMIFFFLSESCILTVVILGLFFIIICFSGTDFLAWKFNESLHTAYLLCICLLCLLYIGLFYLSLSTQSKGSVWIFTYFDLLYRY